MKRSSKKTADPTAPSTDATAPDAGAPAADVAPKRKKASKSATKANARDTARPGGKKAKLIALIQRPEGATLAEIVKRLGWQKHTVRGVISILGSKEGFKIKSAEVEGQRTYHIAGK